MKLSTDLLLACLAGSALAAPGSGLADRLQARSLDRQTRPNQRVETDGQTQYKTLDDVQYSNNWAGGVRTSPPSEGTYSFVSASFVVPEPQAVENTGGTQAASAWVGVDGDTYTEAILQTGVDFFLKDGAPVYSAWYEWYPEKAYDFDLDLKAGDQVVTSVQAISPSEGIVVVENRSTGQKATRTLSAPSADATLGGQNADWIVEDFQAGGNLVDLVNFGMVDFIDTVAQAGGASFGVQDATIIDLKQDDKVVTQVTALSDSELEVKFTG